MAAAMQAAEGTQAAAIARNSVKLKEMGCCFVSRAALSQLLGTGNPALGSGVKQEEGDLCR